MSSPKYSGRSCSRALEVAHAPAHRGRRLAALPELEHHDGPHDDDGRQRLGADRRERALDELVDARGEPREREPAAPRRVVAQEDVEERELLAEVVLEQVVRLRPRQLRAHVRAFEALRGRGVVQRQVPQDVALLDALVDVDAAARDLRALLDELREQLQPVDLPERVLQPVRARVQRLEVGVGVVLRVDVLVRRPLGVVADRDRPDAVLRQPARAHRAQHARLAASVVDRVRVLAEPARARASEHTRRLDRVVLVRLDAARARADHGHDGAAKRSPRRRGAMRLRRKTSTASSWPFSASKSPASPPPPPPPAAIAP